MRYFVSSRKLPRSPCLLKRPPAPESECQASIARPLATSCFSSESGAFKDAGHRRREILADLVVQWSDGSWDDGITEDGRRFANELEAGGFYWCGQKYNFAWLDGAEADRVVRELFS